jgi:YebC/PmpR family DNA-binding regulatory protein
MAGHSQFKNIMYRKGAQDARRSKLFSKLSREITVAVKAAGPDPDGNSRLRLAIQNARAQNMPNNNVERAIKKALGGEAESYDEVRYEGYGPGGVAIIVEALTDNRNRTVGAIRSLFSKYGGHLGESNSVAFLFRRLGEIVYGRQAGDAEKVLDAAIEAGADDVFSDGTAHTVACAFEDLGEVAQALQQRLGDAQSVKAVWKPQTLAPVDEERAATLLKLIAGLEDDDDVQSVYANFEVSDSVLAKLTAA